MRYAHERIAETEGEYHFSCGGKKRNNANHGDSLFQCLQFGNLGLRVFGLWPWVFDGSGWHSTLCATSAPLCLMRFHVLFLALNRIWPILGVVFVDAMGQNQQAPRETSDAEVAT